MATLLIGLRWNVPCCVIDVPVWQAYRDAGHWSVRTLLVAAARVLTIQMLRPAQRDITALRVASISSPDLCDNIQNKT